MNLKELFEKQRILDERIIDEKGLEGQDLLPDKVLALQVELGELANEARFFKFWSENREPRTKMLKSPAMFEEDKIWCNPLLEEYVDCLHFILSIGLEINIDTYVFNNSNKEYLSLTEIFIDLFYLTTKLVTSYASNNYGVLVMRFISLGEMLGFSEEQIEQAYKEKNATNHLRQTNGY